VKGIAAWRRAIESSPGDEDMAKLNSIAQSRTEPAQADQSRRNFCVTNRRNPRLLQKFSSSSGLDLQFATAAKACQHPRHPRHPRVLTPRTPRKRLEPVMIVFATKSVAARRRLTPPQEAAFGIRLSMQCRRTFLTRSMILSTPVVVATPVRRRSWCQRLGLSFCDDPIGACSISTIACAPLRAAAGQSPTIGAAARSNESTCVRKIVACFQGPGYLIGS
jgi:hypothetical protein